MVDFELPASPLKGIDNIGDLITKLIPYIYIFAGFSMIIMIIIGGFNILTSEGSPEKTKIGADKISKGIVGFLLVVVSYFVVMLVEEIFNIKIF
jgi:hypothetical protein